MALARRAGVLALLGALALTGTSASAQTTTTECFGGTTDSNVLRLSIPDVVTVDSGLVTMVEGAWYFAHTDGTLWKDSNGKSGLQRTARVCYEQTVDGGVILSSRSWIEYEADTPVSA